MVRALVTGATGFIGSHLVERLMRDGVEVRCLVRCPRRAAALRARGATLVAGDVTDPSSLRAAVADADVVHHLAGLTLAFNFRDFLRVNAAGTANLAAACARVETPPVLVYVSSVAAAGPSRLTARAPRRRAPVSHWPQQVGGRAVAARSSRVLARHHRAPADRFRPARRYFRPLSLRPTRLAACAVLRPAQLS
jgi:nucleoside-diphosphate-sugar epimerase